MNIKPPKRHLEGVDRTFKAKNDAQNVSKDAPFKACGAVLASQLEAQISGVQVGYPWTKEL